MVFLETERLRLRNVENKDVDEMFDYRNYEICAKFQRGQTKDYNGIKDLVKRRGNDILTLESPSMIAVALIETDELIGEIIVMPNDGTISLGYTFSYKIHRQGYAYEALSALIQYLHNSCPEWDFLCFTDVLNDASRKLLTKLGYEDLGYLPSKDSQVYGKWLRSDTLNELTNAVE